MLVKKYPCKNDTSETVVFSSGLGGHADFWLPQIESFTEHYNVICYEQEGVSPDSALLPDNYSMQDLAEQLFSWPWLFSDTDADIVAYTVQGSAIQYSSV